MLLVSFSVTVPLDRTARDMLAVSLLDFKHRGINPAKCRAPSSFIDEIVRINTSAGVLANGAQAFTQFVPHGVAMDLMANSRGVAEFHTTRRNVAMLTATIANFNGITEAQEPEHTAKMLKAWYEAFDAIVVKHRGTIVRFEGGAISIVFGDPIALDDPEIAASKCALAMRKYLENRKEHTLGFDCYIGIHAGTVMIGTMGTKSRMSYSMCGGDARVADEIAEIGAFYGVSPVLTGTIREKVRESHTCILIDVIKLRGHMNKLTPIYHLVATNPPAEGPLANQVIAQASLYLDAIHKAVRVGDPVKARAIIGEMVQNSVFSSYVLALQMINAHIEEGSLTPASYAELGA
jgi:class 3 adenylate cyclase